MQPALQVSWGCSFQINPQRMLPSFGLSSSAEKFLTSRNSGKFGEAQDQCFWGLRLHKGVLKCGGFPYLWQWASQKVLPLRARLVCLEVTSESSLGREEQGQAQEQSLKDRKMLAGMKSKKMKARGWDGLLGLGRTMGSSPAVKAARNSS